MCIYELMNKIRTNCDSKTVLSIAFCHYFFPSPSQSIEILLAFTIAFDHVQIANNYDFQPYIWTNWASQKDTLTNKNIQQYNIR